MQDAQAETNASFEEFMAESTEAEWGVGQAAAVRRAAAAGCGRRRGATGRHVVVADEASRRNRITVSGHTFRCRPCITSSLDACAHASGAASQVDFSFLTSCR